MRFWRYVDKDGPSAINRITGADIGPCWLWLAQTCGKGYGRFKIAERSLQAHRVAYEWIVDAIPVDSELDHLCRVHNCVNPSHLDPVKHQVNVDRGDAGQHWAAKTHCPQGHPYSGANLYRRTNGKKNGARLCLTCKRARDRENARKYRERKRGAA